MPLLLIVFPAISNAQWSLKLSSNVELRNWKLSNKADKEEVGLSGASIILTQFGKIVTESKSQANGDFTILVPPNGDYILTVSYPGCNSKKFSINTQGVPENVSSENFKPSFSIGGFVMAKPFPGIDYSGLQQTLIKVEYVSKDKRFDSNDNATENGLEIISKISESENILISNFCSTNKLGDIALSKPDCLLAKSLYEKATTIIPGEIYPVDQLKKVDQCLKEKAEAEKKAEANAINKSISDSLAKEKAAKIALEQKKEADEKKEAEKKAIALKEEQSKLAKAAKEKRAKEIAEKNDAEKKAKEEEARFSDAATNKTLKETPSTNKQKTEKQNSETVAKTTTNAKPNKVSPSPKTSENKLTSTSPGEQNTTETTTKTKRGNSDYSIPQVLGLNKYTEAIKQGDGYYKMKRYQEAKTSYQEALKEKANDPYATSKLNTIEKLLAPK